MNNFIILVLGRKGSGKTVFVKRAIPNFKKLVIVDTLNEYDGYINILAPGDLIDFFKSAPEDFIIVLKELNTERLNQYFRILNEVNGLTIICEECDNYFSSSAPDSSMLDLLKYGRHKGTNSLCQEFPCE